MTCSLIINGKDFTKYLKEDGISFGKTMRVTKTLTVMDGTLYKKEIEKRVIEVSLFDDLYDSITINGETDGFTALCSYLKTNPATVSYTDFENGTTITNKLFYINDLKYSITKTMGGVTVINGATFSLEEK